MSLASLNVKITKGKQKILPKLKTILANPYKSECASLDLSELETVKQLLCNEIKQSGVQARTFATAENISIGLESVLRAINNSRCSCVFIAASIKPRHVVNLIARNSELKNPRAPIFLVSQLEILTKEIFGVRTMAFALPVAIEHLSKELKEWIASRQKNIKTKLQRAKPVTKRKIKIKSKVLPLIKEINLVKDATLMKEPNSNCISGDFIPFNSSSQNNEMNNLDLEADRNELVCALSKMTNKVVRAEDSREKKTERINKTKLNNRKSDSSPDVSTDDNYLQTYQPLEVHKILSNPNRTQKKRQKIRKK